MGLKVRDVRWRDGTALAVRVIGKGDKERLVPLPDKFGQVFGFWLKSQPAEDYVFAQKPKGPPPGAHAARAYLRRLKDKAHIAKPSREDGNLGNLGIVDRPADGVGCEL